MRSAGTMTVWVLSLALFDNAAMAQASEESTAPEEDSPPQTETGECFTTSAVMDMTVFNDSAVYVRTRSRHFLVITRGECSNLRRAYNRNEVGFVPYGRRICPSDGSHLLYESGGRNRICPIGAIVETESRAEAREIAESNEAILDDGLIITRDLDPAEQSE